MKDFDNALPSALPGPEEPKPFKLNEHARVARKARKQRRRNRG